MSYPEKRSGSTTGKWIAEVTIAGQRTRMRFDSRASAASWEALSRAMGKPAPVEGRTTSARYTFGPVALEARRQRETWKVAKDTSLDQRLADAIAFLGAATSLDSITEERLDAFVAHLEARSGRSGTSLSAKTVNRYLAVVSGVMDYARRRRYIASAPLMPWQRETQGRLEWLTEEQEGLVSYRLTAEERLCLKVLIATGMRAGEFFNLKPTQLDTEGGWVHLHGDQTKSGKARTVPLHLSLIRPLRDAVIRGELPSHEEFYLAFTEACEALGLSSSLCVHSLRHTTGTRWAQKGIDGALIQKLLGHADYKTTQKYIHLASADLERAARVMQGSPVRELQVVG